MVLRLLAGTAYGSAAVALASIAVIARRREAHNPTFAVALTCAMAGASWWSAANAVAVASTNQTVAAIGVLAARPGESAMVAAFVGFGLATAWPQWVPRRRVVAALLVEPVLITLAAATNPWHLLVFRGAGAATLTGSAQWRYGPVLWAHNWYSYLALAVGIGLVARAWRNAPSASRSQRLAVFLAALVPVATHAAYRIGGGGGNVDPTPLGFAVTAVIFTYAVFQQDLFAFSPVARALILDQIGDAIVVVSAAGRVLDLNPAAVELARGMNPDAGIDPVGASVQEVFGESIDVIDEQETDVTMDLPGGRTEFQVRASQLVDRRHRVLGSVLVARDVTEASALSRRLFAAHAQLVRQVATIEGLRADLAELASRDALTGLHNRRHLVERFASMLVAAQDAGGTIAVTLFDVDRFKAINDEFGHLAGDGVLVALARRIQELSPADALVARWGGEEFFVALPAAGATAGLAFAEAVRRRCAQDPIVVDGHVIRCPLSAGVATFPESGATITELFQAADVALYEAKNAGRNRVRLYQDQAPPRSGPPGDEPILRPGTVLPDPDE
jgi:diguanylate cyclase (GGDEF)-like protein